ncbi:MAG TPA: hypothetical protein VHK01_21980 [Lacipirellulaceae bacterium]|jgi:hypothetical protein|nr:hypothetical protein [Lacipirellulaceae bacterium]
MGLGFPPLLLADIGDVIGGALALLVPLLWVLKQVFEGAKKVEPPRPAGGGAAAGEPAAAGAGAQPAGQQADPLRNQVEEFLRRAGRGPQGNQPGQQHRPARPAPPREVEVLLDEDAAIPSERRPLAEPLRPIEPAVAPLPPRPQAAAAARKPRPPRRPPQPRRESVAEHVAENVAAHAKAIAEQTARLGQRIVEDDHQFDVQLKAKFDHTVGTLTGSAVTAAEQAAAAVSAADTPAAQIATLLANPEGVRQAIIINEIIRRPSERW